MPDIVLLAREGDIATVTLNRPEKLNALNLAMWRRLDAAMQAVAADTAVRCVVLRGAGERAFSPGADISEFTTVRATPAQAEAYAEIMYPALAAVRDCPHPTVAMIHGLCVGAGLEIAALCDLRICGRSSRFGVPIQRLGLTMGYPEIGALIELVGRATALEILLDGRLFEAAEAYDKRLVTRVVPDEAVTAEAMAAARRIADGAPLVHRWHKTFARRCLDPTPLSPAERAEGFAACATEDYRTGVRAFLAKQKPRFEGR
jgi:enoyl-CoA hydratase/carnithine racemase